MPLVEPILRAIEPGFTDEQVANAARLTRIVLPAQIFFILGQLLTAVQFAREKFIIPTLGPLVYNLAIIARWEDPNDAERHVAWVRGANEAMDRFTTGGVYVNYLGEEGQDRVRAAYGEDKYARLVALKDKYDPDNFFRINQNIPPA